MNALPDGVRLTNVEALSEKLPHYVIPPRALRLALKPRELVALSFEFRWNARATPEVERLWCRVAEVTGHDGSWSEDGQPFIYLGVLESVPMLMPAALDYGSQVRFGAHHVAAIEQPRPRSSVSPPRAA